MRRSICKWIPRAVLAIGVGVVSFVAGQSRAAIVITEVDPTGSSSSSNTYKQDWFELTNTGSSAQDITGWKMDDNSHTYANAVALNGVTSIAAGQSVVFVEDTGSSSDATLDAAFENFWFGSNVPAGFTIGNYGGSGVGLGSSADEVNIYDASGNEVTGVGFGASTTGVSFDNVAGIGSNTQPDPLISTLSSVGVDGAFSSAGVGSNSAHEIGSPGLVPEPASALLAGGLGMLLLGRRRLRAAV